MALANLTQSLIIAALLVMLVLGAFLYGWRTAFISMVAIVVSLFAALFVLYLRGATLNSMVLAGLVVALGIVVDDAVVDVENIMRRLRQNSSGGRTSTGGECHSGSFCRDAQFNFLRYTDYIAGNRAGLLYGRHVCRPLPTSGNLLFPRSVDCHGSGFDGYSRIELYASLQETAQCQ